MTETPPTPPEDRQDAAQSRGMTAAVGGAVALLQRLRELRLRREAGELDEGQYRKAFDELVRSARRTDA